MGSIFVEGMGRRGGGGGSYDREQGAGGMLRPKIEMNIKYDRMRPG